MKKKQQSVVPQTRITNPRIGRAITRVRFLTPPDFGVAVDEGSVEGRSFCENIRPGLIAKEVPVGVRKWQSKRRASRTGLVFC